MELSLPRLPFKSTESNGHFQGLIHFTSFRQMLSDEKNITLDSILTIFIILTRSPLAVN